MKKLLHYLRHYKLQSILGPLFKMTEAIFELLVPIVMARIIDVGIRNQDRTYIMWMCALMILLGILGLTCSLTAQYFAAKAAAGFGTELRTDMFAHINNLSFHELDKQGTSTLVTRMTSDVNQAQTAVNMGLRLLLRAPFIVVGSLILSFTISIPLAWIFVVMVPLLAASIFLIMWKSIPMYKVVQRHLDRVLMKARENLSGVRVVRAFSRQDKEKEEFESESAELMGKQLFVGKVSALLNPVTYVIVNVAIIVLIWKGAWQVNTGGITQGELIALISYMTQILVAMVAFANLIVSVIKGIASAERINEVMDEKPGMTEFGDEKIQKNKGTTCVEFKDVSFRYGEENEEALSNINCRFDIGETIGIIGGTGSGKSTLMYLIGRLYDTTQGEVRLYGKPVKDYGWEELRRNIGIVPQQPMLFSGTIRENMKWGYKDASDEQIWEALRIAQAAEFVQGKEDGLDSRVSEGGRNFSGGQRQRLTIARAIVGMPKILILDDSSSALDFATDAALRKAIHESTDDMTVFIVSGRAGTLKNADEIVVMDDGEIVGIGKHEELAAHCPVYREICISQEIEIPEEEEVQQNE